MTSSALLQGKRVLVTGAGRGIGRSVARICHQHGAHVAICSRTLSELQETAASTTNMSCHVADVTQADQVQKLMEEIVEIHGGLDILINNAGGAQTPKASVDELWEHSQQLSQLLNLNVVGVHLVTSAAVKFGKLGENGSGHICNISSKAGKVGLPNYSFYVASKFALEGLTASWAKELQGRNIVVNSISPGMVNTQSFPKPADKPGVRTAESIEDSLLMALTAGMDYSGHYVHVDELDLVRSKGFADERAWKRIDEETFASSLEKFDTNEVCGQQSITS